MSMIIYSETADLFQILNFFQIINLSVVSGQKIKVVANISMKTVSCHSELVLESGIHAGYGFLLSQE